MNNRLLIFLFLVLISENVFSQNIFKNSYFDEEKAEAESDSIHMDTYFQLMLSTDKSLRDAKDRINLLEKYAKIKEDSLRGCLNQKNEENLEIESNSLLNVGKYYALIIAVQDYKNRNFSDLKYTIRDAEALQKRLIRKKLINVQVTQSTAKSGSVWYRVMVGPFQNRSMLNKAQDTLVQMNFSPLERKR